jgi:predicted phage tail protein
MGAATQYSVDVPPGTYYVRVRSANAVGVSGPSNEITVRGAGAPSQPTALSASNSASAVTLRWTAPSGAAPTGYILEAGSAPGLANLAVVQLGAQTTYVAAAPPPGTYYVRVRAVNARGTSAPSNEITVRR